MLVYEVTVGTTARDVVGHIVDEAKVPINIAGGLARLQGSSADLPTVYLNEACVVTDDASGTVTLHEVGTCLTAAQLGVLEKATFRCKFYYEDGAGASDFSDALDITFLAPPIPTFTLTATFTVGTGHGITLSPTGGVYPAMTVVTVTATGAAFASWGGADAADMSVATNPATITMNENKAISAVMT